MIRYDRRGRLFVAALAGLAGFVDAVGFLRLGGFFVSFMSGNSTRLAVGIAGGPGGAGAALTAGSLVAAFVAGVAGGVVLGHRRGADRPRVVLVIIAALLATAGVLVIVMHGIAPMLLVAFAMGAMNTALDGDREGGIAITYMTGTLVRVGRAIGHALLGEPGGDALPWLLLWCGLVTGAVLGAATAIWIPAGGLFLASIWALALAVTRPK